MNSHNEIRNIDEQNSNTSKFSGRRRWIGYSLGGLLGILGVTSLSAVAMGGPDGWCRGDFKHMHWGGKSHREGIDPAGMRQFAEYKIDRVLYELDATPEQRQRVIEILGRAFSEAGERREMRQKERQVLIEILSQPEIDLARLQALRTEKVKQMEEMSERMVQAVADAAEVLTPEQRVKLGEIIEKRGFGPGLHRW